MSQKNNFDLSDFFPISSETWENKIVKELEPQSNIHWTSKDIALKPFYTAKDLENLTYLTNFHSYYALKVPRHWYTLEAIKVDDIREANIQAVSLLNKGADAIAYQIDKTKISKENISILLKNISFHFSPVHFYIKGSPLILAEALQQLGYFEMKGSVKTDSQRNFLQKNNPAELNFHELAATINKLKEIPRFKVLTIDGSLFNQHDSAIKEIAYSVSLALEYIDQLTDKGIDIKDVLTNFEFSFHIDKDYFMEIAKLRAFRLVWNKITEVCDKSFNSFSTPIHCTTSTQSFSKENPYKNILYNTTEAMSAIIGGCDSLHIVPFQEENLDFSSRISKNISLILKDETCFDKTVDPSAGSYFIENLTNELVEKSWVLISDIERQGGFLKNYKF